MKLIFCKKCKDVFRLTENVRECECKTCGGKYEQNGRDAVIWGGEDVIPLGFNNTEFVQAFLHQPEIGLGKRFEAFVIPKNCPTIKITKTRICPTIEITRTKMV